MPAYQERSSLRGREPTFGVHRATVRTWFKKAEQRPSQHQTPSSRKLNEPVEPLNSLNAGRLLVAKGTKGEYSLLCVEKLATLSAMQRVYVMKYHAVDGGNQGQPSIDADV